MAIGRPISRESEASSSRLPLPAPVSNFHEHVTSSPASDISSKPSLEITPASPISEHPPSRTISGSIPANATPSTDPNVPIGNVQLRPTRSGSRIVRSLNIRGNRSASPVPDFIDTGVKGTPNSTRPPSPTNTAGARQDEEESPRAALGGDIPKPQAGEEGLTDKSEQTLHHNISRSSEKAPATPHWPPWKRGDGWSGWCAESIITSNLVPSLVLQAFSTGILDATTYADFRTFASNQTGNTILLTVSVIGDTQILLLLTGISLAAFLGGAFVFGHLGHWMGVRRRLWILTSTTYQIIALMISAILVSPQGPTVTQIGGKHQWVVLFLFANMSGAQVAMARQSGSQELPTAPMTSSYVDLMADKYIFVGFRHPKAGPRNRRLSYILAMIIGGFIGAAIRKYAGSWVVVVVTIALKIVVFCMLAVVKPMEHKSPKVSNV